MMSFEEEEKTCLESLPPFRDTLKSLIRSLRCPNVENFISRFEDQLNVLILAGGTGVSVHDLADLVMLISLTFELVDENPSYVESFYKLLDFCSQNLIFIKSSEMVTYAEVIQDFFSMLGFLLGSTENMYYIEHILDCILKTVTMAKKKPFLQSSAILDALANSKMPPILTELLLISEFDVYVMYLTFLEQLFASNTICQAFLRCNIFNIVMKRVCLKWRDEINYPDEVLPTLTLPPHLNLSQRILWALTMVYNESSAAFKKSIGYLVEGSSWRGPRNILVTLITSNQDKHMRNMFYLLLRTIAATVPYHYYRSLNNELHLLTFTTEVEQSHPWATHMILRPDKLDFEFKLMLISILNSNRTYPQSLDTFRKMNVLEGIFTLIDTNVKLIWSTYQRLELMKGALIGMENIIPHVIEDFVQQGGPAKLLKVLSNVNLQTLILPTLRCINTSLNVQSYSHEKIAKHYRMKKIIDVLTTLIESVATSAYLTKMNLACLAVTFCILEKVARRGEPKLIDITKLGMTILHRFIIPNPSDSFLPPKLLIALMSFMWENVVRCENGRSDFISSGGVYAILDVIEKYPLAIKVLGLSIVADFCEIQDFLACILTWRGRSGQTIIPFLLNIYKEQALFDKDHSNVKSTLRDIEIPILGERHDHIKKKHRNNEYSSATALDFLGNCKPKVYAILTLLKCSKHKDLIDETYKISRETLTNEENIVAILAENYLPLMIGEAWVEVNHHFSITGIRPLVFDQEVIATKLREYRQRTKLIQVQQFMFQISENNADIRVERELYDRLREEVLADSLEALQELRYYTKCVDTLTRMSECLQLNSETEQMVADNVDKSMLVDFHKTLPQYINTTKLFNQKVNIQSNVIIDPNKEEPPEVVSEESLDQDSLAARRIADMFKRRPTTSYDVTRSRYSRNYSVDYH